MYITQPPQQTNEVNNMAMDKLACSTYLFENLGGLVGLGEYHISTNNCVPVC